MKKRYYIAYGSNMSISQMSIRCPHSRLVGRSEIKDYELLFKGSQTGSYLTIEKKEGGIVPAIVWETTEEDEAALDRYEGFPTFYYKTELELPVKSIKTDKISKRSCYVYIMHEDRKAGLPTPEYIHICLSAYRFYGFDTKSLSDALDESWRLCNED